MLEPAAEWRACGGRGGLGRGWAGARAWPVGGGLWAPAPGSGLPRLGLGLGARGSARAGPRAGGWGAGAARPAGSRGREGRARRGARSGGGRGRAGLGAAHSCSGRPPPSARRSMAAAARTAPRGPARRLQCSLESNRLSRRDVSAPPPRPPVLPPPRAGLPLLPPSPLPRLRVPGRSGPRSVVIVTSQRDGPGWNLLLLLLLRDVKSRAGGSRRRGGRGRREASGGGGRGGAGLRLGRR